MADENKQPVYESEGQPELDVVTPSTMTARKKTVSVIKVDADGRETTESITVDDVRSVQLNEKISDTMYQILHPETDAYQVITDPNRRFVTDKDKAKWNQAFDLGASALHYKGAFNRSTAYHQYDVVHVDFSDADCEYILQEYDTEGNFIKNVDVNGRQFFIYIDNSANAQWPNTGVQVTLAPKHGELETSTGNNQAKWVNINYEAYLAEHARKVEVTLDNGEGIVNLVYANDFDAEKVEDEQREHAGRYQDLKESKNLQFVPSDSKVLINSESEGYHYTPIELNGADQKITMRNVVKNADEEIEVKDTIVLDGKTGHITGSIDKALYADVANYYDDGSADNKSDLTINEKFITLEKSLTPDGNLFEHLTIVDENNNELGTYYPLDTDNNPQSTIKIKQSYTPNDLQPGTNGAFLGANDKIREEWLPDTILGAMQYIGTFDASTGNMDVDLRPLENGQPRPFRTGDYAIVIKQGDLDPSKAAHIPNHDHEDDPTVPSEECFFLVGDWAVYHDWHDDKEETVDPTGWSKIDNVDSVRTVNDQIGNVKTYKGAWNIGVKYYAGDIVSYDTNTTDTTEPSLYLCIKNTFENGTNNNTTPDKSECFKIFGKVYTADYGIEITPSDVIQHKFKNATSDVDDTKIDLQDKKDEQDRTITVSHTVLTDNDDNTGHVSQVTTRTFIIPRDTWRPVNLEGGAFLDKEIDDTKTLNLATKGSTKKGDNNSTRIEITKDGSTAYFSHTLNKAGVAGNHTSGKVKGDGFADDNKLYLGSKFTAPTFEWDKSGHIDAYSKVVFEIPSDLVQHEHFKVDSTSGVGVIRSYTLKEYEDERKTSTHHRLFVDGYDTKDSDANIEFKDTLPNSNEFILPESQARMTFNGQFAASTLFQTGRKNNAELYRVVDESAKVNSGNNYAGQVLETIFDSENNKFELADSGVIPTDKTEPAVFSAVAVNKKGITVAGGQILEFGANEGDNPSDSLVIGGLFFRNMGARNKEDGTNSVNYYYK